MKFTITCGRKFHSDHLAAAFQRVGMLERIITGNPRFAYRRHQFDQGKLFHTLPFYLPGLLGARLGLPPRLLAHFDWRASQMFDRAAAKRIGAPDVVIAWAWSALTTLQTAKQKGAVAVLEECGSANAHQEAILTEEHELLKIRPRARVPDAVIDNEKRECDAADYILCPSDYVADSFSIYGVPRERCIVLPYASNPKFKASAPKELPSKINVLYVGSVGPRKGVIYLLRALDLLPRNLFSCTIIGRVDPEFSAVFRPYRDRVTYIESVPHSEMPSLFRDATAFVLPTLDEGMAYVIMEALASATPVITTENSGALGKVLPERNGLIVPLRNSEAIAQSLTKLTLDAGTYRRYSEEALREATEWSWDNYVASLVARLQSGGDGTN